LGVSPRRQIDDRGPGRRLRPRNLDLTILLTLPFLALIALILTALVSSRHIEDAVESCDVLRSTNDLGAGPELSISTGLEDGNEPDNQ
jgi:hypothetical protein